jgi:hypothetical protein
MGNLPLNNSAVFLTLSWTGKLRKTSKPPRFTTWGVSPNPPKGVYSRDRLIGTHAGATWMDKVGMITYA